jgi:threonylcarbamoyladenosine tRNA methylthiotransferase CDKAL1
MKTRGAYIETYGCAANQAESETMAGILREAGFALAESPEEGGLIIVNTCFVKTPTEQKIKYRIRSLTRKYPEKGLIIAGCMPEVLSKELQTLAPSAGLVGTHSVTRIAEAAERSCRGERVSFTGKTKERKLGSPRVRGNRLVGITEISQGCNGSCAYCCVRLAKGRLHCYPPEDIAKDVENAVMEGCREIWLTSQDNASYSCGGVRLPGLAKKVCAIGGGFAVRIGMMNPDSVMKIADGLIGAYRSPKVYKFLHIPVQSGSDAVLSRMGRNYSAGDFLSLVSRFRREIPGITISTDIIVGFPGESDEDFLKTADMIKSVKPDIVNVSKFGSRPGTEAAGMEQLEGRIIKSRSARLSSIVRGISLERNREWTRWKGEVLVTERGKRKCQYIGRNFAYKPVLLESTRDLLGSRVSVIIEGAAETHLEGVPA